MNLLKVSAPAADGGSLYCFPLGKVRFREAGDMEKDAPGKEWHFSRFLLSIGGALTELFWNGANSIRRSGGIQPFERG
jgi:hypothetical protein